MSEPLHAPNPSSDAARTGGLSERDRQILAFERDWWRQPGAKEQTIRETFGLSSTRYYQILNDLIDQQAALEADPLLVKRLQRLRSSRMRQRTARRLGFDDPS
ncbi:DUF3263 domain-containing protein [Branchiibius cervicis]|uniref:DUF3263 domain-containing protein n=1 Tax=Branchiibius cervicis TaxID=908252 RepID=A0ABW2AW92_9MICO